MGGSTHALLVPCVIMACLYSMTIAPYLWCLAAYHGPRLQQPRQLSIVDLPWAAGAGRGNIDIWQARASLASRSITIETYAPREGGVQSKQLQSKEAAAANRQPQKRPSSCPLAAGLRSGPLDMDTCAVPRVPDDTGFHHRQLFGSCSQTAIDVVMVVVVGGGDVMTIAGDRSSSGGPPRPACSAPCLFRSPRPHPRPSRWTFPLRPPDRETGLLTFVPASRLLQTSTHWPWPRGPQLQAER